MVSAPVVQVGVAQRRVAAHEDCVLRIAVLRCVREVEAAGDNAAIRRLRIDDDDLVVRCCVLRIDEHRHALPHHVAQHVRTWRRRLLIDEHCHVDAASVRRYERISDAPVREAVRLHKYLQASRVDSRDDHTICVIIRRERVLYGSSRRKRCDRQRALARKPGTGSNRQEYADTATTDHAYQTVVTLVS